MKRLLASVLVVMLLPALAGAAVQTDVVADITFIKSGSSGSKTMTYEMGWTVLIRCYDTIQLVKKGDLWKVGQDLKWQTLVQVDNKTVHVHEGSIGAGTFLGTSYNYPNGKSKPPVKVEHPKVISKMHPVVSWKPPGPGTYEARCIANYQATIPDATSANNTAIAVATIVPKAPPPPPPASATLRGVAPAIRGQTPATAVEAPASARLNPGTRIAAPIRLRQSVVSVEAETLLASNKVLLQGGNAVPQPMGAFGGGWSGGAQLFWRGGAVGATLDLLMDVPQDGAWIVEIGLTRAPDYGQLSFEVDHHPVAAHFDGYAPAVTGPATVSLGTFAMQQGQRPVSLMVVGRNNAATGWLAGVDFIRLRPAGN